MEGSILGSGSGGGWRAAELPDEESPVVLIASGDSDLSSSFLLFFPCDTEPDGFSTTLRPAVGG